MKSSLFIVFSIVFLVFGKISFGQRKVHITVKLPNGIAMNKMTVLYDDGQYLKSIKPIILNNTLTISEFYYSRYANLIFAYPDSTETDGLPCFSFLIRDDSAHIYFSEEKLVNKNPFRNYRLEKALTLADIGDNQYRKFISKESDDAKRYYTKNSDSIRTKKKYQIILEKKKEKLDRKILEFIALNPNQYISLLVFKNDISQSSSLKADSLLQFFNQVFPDSLRSTYEGQEAFKRLNGRINTEKWGEAPDFSEKDIKGNIIALKNLRGKYVLLDFWASWCAPCLREMPVIKRISHKYPKDKLEIISITLDKTYGNFIDALKKLNPDWTQIFQGSNLVAKYAVGPVPMVFLINEKGIVVYNRSEEHDNGLIKLNKILEREIK